MKILVLGGCSYIDAILRDVGGQRGAWCPGQGRYLSESSLSAQLTAECHQARRSGLACIRMGSGRIFFAGCRLVAAQPISTVWGIHVNGADVIGIQHAEIGDPAHHQMLWPLRLTEYPEARLWRELSMKILVVGGRSYIDAILSVRTQVIARSQRSRSGG